MIEKINFRGWPNSYRMTNGEVELVITGDVGPRIIRFAFVSGRNLFHEYADEIGRSGESVWRNRGGHRLWVAPEVAPPSPITYAADNSPIKMQIKGDVLTATAPVEPGSGLEKQLIVKMAPRGSEVSVLHRLRNHNPWTIELAAWGLTVLAPGGTGIMGLPPRGTHPEMLAPTNPLVIWAFTDLSDKRWRFTAKYVLLRQDRKAPSPQKIGSFSCDMVGAYHLGNQLFIKRYRADPAKTYPDMGACFEMFANADVLELETLGPLTRLAPGAALDHLEHWSLHRNVRIKRWNDSALDAVFRPLVRGAQRR